MKSKTRQQNLILFALVVLIAVVLLPRMGVRLEPITLLNQFGITSRDVVAAAIGAALMYLFLKQR